MSSALIQRLASAYDRSDVRAINDDLRAAVRASDRTVTEWARLLGVPQPHVSRWLSGGSLPVRHLETICKFL